MVEAEQTGQIILSHSATLQLKFLLQLCPTHPCCERRTAHTRACTCTHMHIHAQNGNPCCKMHAFEVGQDIYCQEGNQQEIIMTATKHIQERFEQNWRENFERLYSSGRKA